MEYRKMRLSESDKLNAKARNKSHIESMTHKLLLYYSDPDKKIRTKEKHECRYCYYVVSRIGVSAITTVVCANCDKEITFGNTCVDVLCDECAEELNLCKHCGQKID